MSLCMPSTPDVMPLRSLGSKSLPILYDCQELAEDLHRHPHR